MAVQLRGLVITLAVVYIQIMESALVFGSDGDLTCVISYKVWDLPDRLRVNWTVPDLSDRGELTINVTRYMGAFEDTCPEASVTSCTWTSGHGNAMSFDYNFTLFVEITKNNSEKILFKKEWDVNPDTCKKPPKIDHLTSDAINSTCVDVRWWYDRTKYCLDPPYYKITLRPTQRAELYTTLTLTGSCNTSHVVCAILPNTQYTIELQAKFNYFDHIVGQYSDQMVATFTTPEDVPSGAPEMVNGSFNLVEAECADKNTRIIRLFWKDVAAELKHGIVTCFLVEIIPHSSPDHGIIRVNISIDGGNFNTLVNIRCDLDYTIELRGETSVGVSPTSSSIYIPKFNSDFVDAVEDIVPVIASSAFDVYWVEKASDQKQLAHVFWCLKGVEIHCLSPINWTTAPNSSAHVNVPVQHGIASHNYLIGVSNGDSGIKWANCYYTAVSDARPPVGVRLESDKSFEQGSMALYWDNKPCESRPPGPYIHQFLISVCEVNEREETKCKGASSRRLANNKRSSYILKDLKAGVLYRVCIQTKGLTNTIGEPACLNGLSAEHAAFLNRNVVIACTLTVAVFLLCAIYGGIKCKSLLQRKLNRFMASRFNVRIPGSGEDERREDIFLINDSTSV